MLVRVFTLKFHLATECFDDEEVQEFIKDKEVLSIREHFFVKQETPYLVLIVTYLPGESKPVSTKKTKDDWRKLLSNEQMPLFEALRSWRAERAKQDGVPPYIICTNKEFVEMATQRPDSLAGLTKIYGFGKAKAEKYGKEILAVLANPPKPPPKTEQSAQQSSDQEEQAPQEGQASREGQPLSNKPDSQQGMFEEGSKQTTSTKGKKPQEKKPQGEKTP
jgi:ATP-dependent DNA helicase RecQ